MTQWVTFKNLPDGKEHVAIVYPDYKADVPPLVRIHSECLTGDVFNAQNCDCGAQLEYAKLRMEKEGGVILYLRQEGRGIGLYEKLKALFLQQAHGMDTYEANRALGHGDDERDFTVAALMLKAIGIRDVRLISGNQAKVDALRAHKISVTEIITPLTFETPHNQDYIKAKRARGHNL